MLLFELNKFKFTKIVALELMKYYSKAVNVMTRNVKKSNRKQQTSFHYSVHCISILIFYEEHCLSDIMTGEEKRQAMTRLFVHFDSERTQIFQILLVWMAKTNRPHRASAGEGTFIHLNALCFKK